MEPQLPDDVLVPGSTMRGVIGQDDPGISLDPHPGVPGFLVVGHAHPLAFAAGGRVTIELESDFFDPFLVLRDGGGRVIATDDDGLLGIHARLVVDLDPAPARYRVEACALDDDRGPYELRVLAGVPEPESARAVRERQLGDARRRVQRMRAEGTPSSLARALMHLGRSARDQAHHDEAHGAFTESLALRTAAGDPDDLRLALAHQDLAKALKDGAEFADARRHVEQAQAMYARVLGPEHAWALTAKHDLGLLLQREGRLQDALAVDLEVLAARERAYGPDHPNVGTACAAVADVLDDQWRLEEAAQCHERALAIAERAWGSDDVRTASAKNDLAVTLSLLREFDRARSLHEEALAVKERNLGPAHPKTATSLENLGECLRRGFGESVAARGLFERALAIRTAAHGPDHPDTAYPEMLLGMVAEDLGDAAEARLRFEHAFDVRRRRLGPDHPLTLESEARVAAWLRTLRLFHEALPHSVGVAAGRERTYGSDHPLTLDALKGLGFCLKGMGQLAPARDVLEDLLERSARRYGAAHARVAEAHRILADVLREFGDTTAALGHYQTALDLAESALPPDSRRLDTYLNNMGALLFAEHRFAEARPYFERVVAGCRARGDRIDRGGAVEYKNLAMTLADLGDASTGFALMCEATDGASGYLRSLGAVASEAETITAVSHERRLLGTTVGLADAVGTDEARRTAYERVVEWKGRISRRLLADKRQLMSDLDDETRRALDDLWAVQSRLSRALVGPGEGAGDEDADRGAETIDDLLRQRSAVERRLASRGGEAVVGAPLTFREIADALPAESVALDFLVLRPFRVARWEDGELIDGGGHVEPRLQVWVIHPGAESPVHLDLGPEAAVAPAAQALVAHLFRWQAGRGAPLGAPPGRPATDPTGGALAHLLLAPLAEHISGAQSVFVSPDGSLASVPLEVLVGEDGRYLVEDHRFVYLSDMHGLAARRELEGAGGADEVVLVGDVDYGAPRDAPPSVDGDEPGARALWLPLPGTRDELDALASLHGRRDDAGGPALVLTGAAATEAAIKRALPGARTIHFATHGFLGHPGRLLAAAAAGSGGVIGEAGASRADELDQLVAALPGLDNGLVLAGANRPPVDVEDGFLTAEEVTWLDLRDADLVVLSACHTGRGAIAYGEGLLGLRRSFHMAGARNVVSSLWPVADDASRDLMADFYRRLWIDDSSPSDALRGAQLAMLKRLRADGQPEGGPVYWGAFVLSGSLP